jgi:prepilin-type N-terminal cleavage/methylation domain-containing protein
MQSDIANKKGFSLIEVLFSLMILSVGLSALALLMASNIQNSINSRDQIIASGLAQEGIEIIRNLKDNNTTPFNDDTSFNVAGSPYTGLRLNGWTIEKGKANMRLYQLAIGSFTWYGFINGSATKFFRTASINIRSGAKATNDRVIEVTVMVLWDGIGTFPLNVSDCTVASKCASTTSVLSDY